MNCKCRRCGTESSIFWHPFIFGYNQYSQKIEPGDVLYFCDNCLHEFVLFLDIDLYMVKERIQ